MTTVNQTNGAGSTAAVAPVATPPAGDATLEDKPKYTEKQWGEMRKKMQAQINDQKTDKVALQNRIDELEENEAVLKNKIVKIQEEFDGELPQEAKEVVAQYRKRLDELSSWEHKQKKEFKAYERQISQREDSERQTLASELSAKFGIDVEDLLNCEDPKSMRAYAAEHFDPAKIKPAEPVQQPNPQNIQQDKLQKPIVPGATPAAGEKTDAQRLAERYPTMNIKI